MKILEDMFLVVCCVLAGVLLALAGYNSWSEFSKDELLEREIIEYNQKTGELQYTK